MFRSIIPDAGRQGASQILHRPVAECFFSQFFENRMEPDGWADRYRRPHQRKDRTAQTPEVGIEFTSCGVIIVCNYGMDAADLRRKETNGDAPWLIVTPNCSIRD